jgi:hypothetical protein
MTSSSSASKSFSSVVGDGNRITLGFRALTLIIQEQFMVLTSAEEVSKPSLLISRESSTLAEAKLSSTVSLLDGEVSQQQRKEEHNDKCTSLPTYTFILKYTRISILKHCKFGTFPSR